MLACHNDFDVPHCGCRTIGHTGTQDVVARLCEGHRHNRLPLVGASHRRVVPLSMIGGAAFLIAADLLARTLASPAEIPIGVITAFFGAPFIIVVLYRRKLSA